MNDYRTFAKSDHFIVLDNYTKTWRVAEKYQSESNLERGLIEHLVNQGYKVPSGLNTLKRC